MMPLMVRSTTGSQQWGPPLSISDPGAEVYHAQVPAQQRAAVCQRRGWGGDAAKVEDNGGAWLIMGVTYTVILNQ